MFTIAKTRRIEAAHRLPSHDGKCRGLHGHTWSITFEVKGQALATEGAKRGMLFDYGDLGAIMKEHVETLDHRMLNDIWDNPTSENIARALYEECWALIESRSGGAAALAAVRVSETGDTWCEFRP